MARPKRNDLEKVTLNLREGDMKKMSEMFPDIGGGPAVRELLTKFVDKHYNQPATTISTKPPEV